MAEVPEEVRLFLRQHPLLGVAAPGKVSRAGALRGLGMRRRGP